METSLKVVSMAVSFFVAFLLGSGINGNQGARQAARHRRAHRVAFLLGSGINGNIRPKIYLISWL